jgi:predicted nucleic acid-binding Zn ribbon protein
VENPPVDVERLTCPVLSITDAVLAGGPSNGSSLARRGERVDTSIPKDIQHGKAHNKAAEHHENGARVHRMAAEQYEKGRSYIWQEAFGDRPPNTPANHTKQRRRLTTNLVNYVTSSLNKRLCARIRQDRHFKLLS